MKILAEINLRKPKSLGMGLVHWCLLVSFWIPYNHLIFFLSACSTTILTEDGLFDMIRKSKPVKVSPQKDLKKQITGKADGSQVKSSPSKRDTKGLAITF